MKMLFQITTHSKSPKKIILAPLFSLVLIAQFLIVGTAKMDDLNGTILLDQFNTKIVARETADVNAYEKGRIYAVTEGKEVELGDWLNEDLQLGLSPDKKTLVFINPTMTSFGSELFMIEMQTGKIIPLHEDLRSYYSSGNNDRPAELYFGKALFNDSGEKFIVDVGFGDGPFGGFCLFDVNKIAEENGSTYSCYSYNVTQEKCYLEKCSPHSNEFYQVNLRWEDGNTLEFASRMDQFEEEIAGIYELNTQTNDIKEISIYPPSPYPDVSENDPDYPLILKARNEGWITTEDGQELGLDEVLSKQDFVNFLETVIPGWVGTPLELHVKVKSDPVSRIEGFSIMMLLRGWEPEENLYCTDLWPDYDDPLLSYAPFASFIKFNKLLGENTEELNPNDPITKRDIIKMQSTYSKRNNALRITGYGCGEGCMPCKVVADLNAVNEIDSKKVVIGGAILLTLVLVVIFALKKKLK